MSKIAEQTKELTKRLKKVEFLNHILESAQNYDHKDFTEVKDDVVKMLEQFVEESIEIIVNGVKKTASPAIVNKGTFADEDSPQVEEERPKPPPKKPRPPTEPGHQDKLSFAMQHRPLADKDVSVANDQKRIVKGRVVGLDAPYVLVKVENGPTIKVPPEKVSVL